MAEVGLNQKNPLEGAMKEVCSSFENSEEQSIRKEASHCNNSKYIMTTILKNVVERVSMTPYDCTKDK